MTKWVGCGEEGKGGEVVNARVGTGREEVEPLK